MEEAGEGGRKKEQDIEGTAEPRRSLEAGRGDKDRHIEGRSLLRRNLFSVCHLPVVNRWTAFDGLPTPALRAHSHSRRALYIIKDAYSSALGSTGISVKLPVQINEVASVCWQLHIQAFICIQGWISAPGHKFSAYRAHTCLYRCQHSEVPLLDYSCSVSMICTGGCTQSHWMQKYTSIRSVRSSVAVGMSPKQTSSRL